MASDRPAPPAAKAQEFMDVNALVAQARTQGAPAQAPSASEEEAAPERPLELAVPRVVPKPPPKSESNTPLKLAILAIALVLVTVFALFLLPLIVRQQAIASAREAGFDITVEGVGIGTSGITLRDVTAKVTRTPGVTATMREVRVAGFSAKKDMRILGLDARLTGERADLEVGLGMLLANDRTRFAGTAAAAHHLSIIDGRLTWDSPKGDHVSASDIGVDVDSLGAGVEDARGSIGRFEVKALGTTFGPWSSSFESNASASRIRIMFDPPIPDGPSALVVLHKQGSTELTVKVPRSSLKNLGIRAAEIGLPADDGTDVQVSITGTHSNVAKSEVTFDASLWGLHPKGMPGALDVHTDGAAKGAPGKPLDLEKTTVTAGPFAADVNGTVTLHDRGARLDALFKARPLACERLARLEAKSLGPLAATLQTLGQSTGALRVTGTVNASGIVKYDTAEPAEGSLTWLAKETCGVSIFGM